MDLASFYRNPALVPMDINTLATPTHLLEGDGEDVETPESDDDAELLEEL